MGVGVGGSVSVRCVLGDGWKGEGGGGVGVVSVRICIVELIILIFFFKVPSAKIQRNQELAN